LTARAATAALLDSLSTLVTRLSGRLAFLTLTAVFALAAVLAAGFDFAGFTGRFAAARPDDLDALLFLEIARAISILPWWAPPPTTPIMTVPRVMMLLVDDEGKEEEDEQRFSM
jgi:hypothetical protein